VNDIQSVSEWCVYIYMCVCKWESERVCVFVCEIVYKGLRVSGYERETVSVGV
jgi:hypothetical protein